MSTWYPRVLLRHYLERGLSNTAIAARVGLSRRTVYRWLATGPLDRDLDPTTVRYPPRRSKPDPYKPPIEERLHVSRAHGRPAVRRGAGCGLSGKPQGYPVKDVAAAGGWKDEGTMLKSYQQADPETIRTVVLHPTHRMVSQ